MHPWHKEGPKCCAVREFWIAHAQPLNGARNVNLCLKLPLVPYMVYSYTCEKRMLGIFDMAAMGTILEAKKRRSYTPGYVNWPTVETCLFLIRSEVKKNIFVNIHKFCLATCQSTCFTRCKRILESQLWNVDVMLTFINGPRQANLVLITYASSEGSGEPAHPRSLARTSAARSYKQWVKRNLQTGSQIPGLSEWLGMRS